MFRIIKYLFLLGLLGAIGLMFFAWKIAYRPNIDGASRVLFIPTGATFNQVLDSLNAKKILKDEGSFKWVAQYLGYADHVMPGRYVMKRNMTNLSLVRKLRGGEQDPVKIRFASHMDFRDIFREIDKDLELSYDSLLALAKNENYLLSLGIEKEDLLSLFIPNTYQFYWNVSPKAFFEKMKKNYDIFWKDERRTKAEKIGLDPSAVMTLASIVQGETYINSERPKVAGLYLNRVHMGMPLQADPTLIFASGDFTIKRVLNIHKKIESPYNTYLHTGIPPGPINNPEPSAIEAVLNYEHHDYIFMCAKADFSGTHNFSRSLSQHNKYAKEYQAALDKLK